jgi:single-strand DNA-binding protein
MYLNQAMVYGNLCRDVELKALPSGSSVASMSVATNRTWNDKDGKKQEEVEYHNIVVFGKQAENCAKYLTKGAGVLVEGYLKTRNWEKDGVKQYRTEIVAERVQFGAKKTTTSEDGKSVSSTTEDVSEEIDPESIPF